MGFLPEEYLEYTHLLSLSVRELAPVKKCLSESVGTALKPGPVGFAPGSWILSRLQREKPGPGAAAPTEVRPLSRFLSWGQTTAPYFQIVCSTGKEAAET